MDPKKSIQRLYTLLVCLLRLYTIHGRHVEFYIIRDATVAMPFTFLYSVLNNNIIFHGDRIMLKKKKKNTHTLTYYYNMRFVTTT